MLAYFRLVRLPNLCIIAFTQYLLRFCIIQPLLAKANISLHFSELDFFLLVLSTVFIAAAGYVINDYFDLKIDRLNKPAKIVLGKKIPIQKAIPIHSVLNALAVFIGFYLGYRLGSLKLAILNPLATIMLWFYSVKYKKMLLFGNIVIALLSAFVVLVVWLFEFYALRKDMLSLETANFSFGMINYLVFGFALFAFLISFIREIIKDVEDMKGDAEMGCRTLPVVIGIKKTNHWLITGIILVIVLLAIAQFSFLSNGFMASFWYFAFVVELMMLFLLFFTLKAVKAENYHFLSFIVKIIMILGILGMVLINIDLC